MKPLLQRIESSSQFDEFSKKSFFRFLSYIHMYKDQTTFRIEGAIKATEGSKIINQPFTSVQKQFPI